MLFKYQISTFRLKCHSFNLKVEIMFYWTMVIKFKGNLDIVMTTVCVCPGSCRDRYMVFEGSWENLKTVK